MAPTLANGEVSLVQEVLRSLLRVRQSTREQKKTRQLLLPERVERVRGASPIPKAPPPSLVLVSSMAYEPPAAGGGGLPFMPCVTTGGGEGAGAGGSSTATFPRIRSFCRFPIV
jgi:hypothetical protein